MDTDEEKDTQTQPIWVQPTEYTVPNDPTKWNKDQLNFDLSPSALYAFMAKKPNDQYICRLGNWDAASLQERFNWAFNVKFQFTNDDHIINYFRAIAHGSGYPWIDDKFDNSYKITDASIFLDQWLEVTRHTLAQAYNEVLVNKGFILQDPNMYINDPKVRQSKDPKYWANMNAVYVKSGTVQLWTPSDQPSAFTTFQFTKDIAMYPKYKGPYFT